MKARLISVLLVLALLVTVGVITAQAALTTGTSWGSSATSETGIADFTNAIAVGADAADQTLTPDEVGGTVTATCYACGSEVTWYPLTAATSDDVALTSEKGHYYVPEGGFTANTKSYTVAKSQTVHLHLNGQTIQSSDNVFTTAYATSAYLVVMGDGEVIGTGATAATYDSQGELAILGGTHSHTEGYYVLRNPANYTKRVWIVNPAVIDGTVAFTSTNYTGTSAGGGSPRIASAKVKRLELPVKYNTSKSVPAIFYGEVQIDELVFPENYSTPTFNLSGEASIGLDASAVGVVLAAADTEAELTTTKGYFHAANANTHEVVISLADTGRYFVNLAKKAGVVTCAGCSEDTVFTEVATAEAGALAAGHYKLTADLTLEGALTVAEDVCIDLNGHSVTSTGRVIEQTAGTLNIFGTGTVTGAATEGDAATILVSGGTLNLKGGTYKHTGTLPTVYLTTGAINMEDGATLTADEGVTGQNLYMYDGTFTMNGGEISNGTATNGGNIYQYNGKLYIKGGEIKDGTATATTGGGNIYCRVGGLYMSAGTISGGKAAPTVGEDETVTYNGAGGNIRFQYMAVNTCTINGTAVITGGFAKEGGNIFHNGGTKKLTIEGKAQITEGFAEGDGGNIKLLPSVNASENTTAISGSVVISGGEAEYGAGIYVDASTEKKDGTEAAVVLNLVGGNYTGGSAINGAFLFQRGGYVNICNGTFTAGNASSKGDLFYLRDGEMLLSGGTMNLGETGDYVVYVGQSSANAPKLVLGKTTSTATGWLNDLVLDEKATANTVYVNNALAALEVLASFENTATLQLQSPGENPVIPVTNYYGATVQNATAEAFTGKLYLARGDKPEILYDGNGGLVVAGALKDGAWTTTADAFATATESIKLYEDEAEVTIETDTVPVDLNGKSITINGSGVVTATNSKATAASELTLNGPTLAQTETAVWADDHFDVVLGEEGAYTLHRLEMRIKSISLRPTTAGLYYTSEIVMDDVLKEQVDEIGVVLAVGDGNVDLSDPSSENVKFVGTKEIGSTVNSVLVNNILKAGAENNADRAGWKVQGAAAVIFKGDLGEAVATAENYAQSRSVNDYMVLANSKFADLSDDNKLGLQNFYNTWKSVTGWNYTDIESWVAPTPEA